MMCLSASETLGGAQPGRLLRETLTSGKVQIWRVFGISGAQTVPNHIERLRIAKESLLNAEWLSYTVAS